MSLRTVLFDLDDTLYDYEQYARDGLRLAAASLHRRTGMQLHGELLSLYFIEDVRQGTFDELAARHELPASLVDDLVEAFHDATTPLRPYPAAEPVLERLEDTYRLGLVTDGREGETKLARLGLEPYFEETLVTPTVDSSKHDPAVFERVLDALDTAPREAVYVGDDPRVDFATANALGLRTVRLRRGRYRQLDPEMAEHGADRTITTLGDLPGLLAQDSFREGGSRWDR